MGQVMLSFEFSVFDLVLSLGVIVLILLFVTTLWKLNPTKENKEPQDEEGYNDESVPTMLPSQPNPQPTVQPSRADSSQSVLGSSQQRIPETSKVVVSATTAGTSHESPQEPQRPIEPAQPPKQAKPTVSSKPVAKDSSAKGCYHHFGYLGGLPKNTPIPNECFGCSKIVDCLITKKK